MDQGSNASKFPPTNSSLLFTNLWYRVIFLDQYFILRLSMHIQWRRWTIGPEAH